jgi:uncharacterized spore protein YtfJ
MKTFDEILTVAQDAITVKRVYGEPYQQNGVTFIPAAAVRGGGGGGEGDPTENTPGGRGGGLGISARPVGAYQITGDEVSWVPAPDITKVIISSQIVAIVALLVIRSIVRKRSKT